MYTCTKTHIDTKYNDGYISRTGVEFERKFLVVIKTTLDILFTKNELFLFCNQRNEKGGREVSTMTAVRYASAITRPRTGDKTEGQGYTNVARHIRPLA